MSRAVRLQSTGGSIEPLAQTDVVDRHRVKLDDILDAYETFRNIAKIRALKVIIAV